MTTLTRVLPVVDEDIVADDVVADSELFVAAEPGETGTVGGIWEVTRARCAAEVNLRVGPLAVWRARLTVIDARLVMPSRDSRGIAEAHASLRATVAVRPAFTSVPLTRGAFLPSAQREQRLSLVASGFPRRTDRGEMIETTATITLDTRTWVSPLTIRVIRIDEELLVLDVLGGAVHRPKEAAGVSGFRIEAAAEFRRCD